MWNYIKSNFKCILLVNFIVLNYFGNNHLHVFYLSINEIYAVKLSYVMPINANIKVFLKILCLIYLIPVSVCFLLSLKKKLVLLLHLIVIRYHSSSTEYCLCLNLLTFFIQQNYTPVK